MDQILRDFPQLRGCLSQTDDDVFNNSVFNDVYTDLPEHMFPNVPLTHLNGFVTATFVFGFDSWCRSSISMT